MEIVTPTDAAWAAGFFDGEACVSVHLHRKAGRVHGYPHVQVVVVQKDPRPITRLQEIFGARETVGVVTRTAWKRPYYRLTFSGTRAADVLQVVLPYLTLKREVAEVALALCADVARYSRRERATGHSPETMAYRQRLVDRAKWLNSGRWAAAETKSSDAEPGTVQ